MNEGDNRTRLALKLPDIDYQCPGTLNDALELISDTTRDIRVLAGGQSLLAALNFRLGDPDGLVDINRIDELAGIGQYTDADQRDWIRIGALTRHNDVLNNPLVNSHLPLVHQAIGHVAHPAIRNRGTIGGSIALADPAAEMPACALAMNARIVCRNAQAERQIAADDFFTGLYETARHADELIVAIDFPVNPVNSHAFYELSRRHGDYAMAGVAATGIGDEQVASSDPRIVLFGISDRPIRSLAAETVVADQPLSESLIRSAADLCGDGIAVFGDPQASVATKRQLARVVTRRALGARLGQTSEAH